jgi:hypothetical protein
MAEQIDNSPGRASEFPSLASDAIRTLDGKGLNRLEQMFVIGMALGATINAGDASKMPPQFSQFKRVLDMFLMHVAAIYKETLEAKVTLN